MGSSADFMPMNCNGPEHLDVDTGALYKVMEVVQRLSRLIVDELQSNGVCR